MNKRTILLLVGLLVVAGVVVTLVVVPPTFWMGLWLRPGHAFDAERVPPAPDYRSESAWVVLPGRDGLAHLVPAGLEPASGPRPADAFFVHPTTYYGTEEWNAPHDDGRAREMRELTIANQASVFNACCRVFVPSYRQAAIGTYFDIDASSLAALRIAYQDVAAAFRVFLEVHNQGRPFLVAGHSQGTQHLLRLLADIGAERERLVAAYAVGYGATTELLGLPPCRGPRDTGCAVAWDTVREGFEAPDLPTYHWSGDELVPTRAPRHCTNPISWSLAGEPAPASQHLGWVLAQLNRPIEGFADLLFADGPLGLAVTGLSAPAPRTVRARCRDGWLEVPEQENPFRADFEAGAGTYHLFDFDLFYMDVRKNAVDRVAAFLAARAAE